MDLLLFFFCRVGGNERHAATTYICVLMTEILEFKNGLLIIISIARKEEQTTKY